MELEEMLASVDAFAQEMKNRIVENHGAGEFHSRHRLSDMELATRACEGTVGAMIHRGHPPADVCVEVATLMLRMWRPEAGEAR